MTTVYPYPLNDHTKPLNVQVKPIVVIDPGNRFVKWLDGQTPCVIPGYTKQLSDWEDAEPDPQSYVVSVNGHRYAIGKLAQDLGGKPAFEEGKAELAHILVLPALAHPDGLPQRVEKLIIPTPDVRNQSVTKLKEIESTIEFSLNGVNQVVTVHQVKPIDECLSSFRLAKAKQLWKFPSQINGIIDFGGGTAIARLFSPNGVLIREADVVLPGTFSLARKISAALLPTLGNSANLGLLMDAIASNTLTYGTTGIDFSTHFQKEREKWVNEIRNELKISWHQYLPSIGEILLIGGSAPLAEPLVKSSKGRFKIAPQPQLFGLYGLALGG
jgi:hypothetical protein